MRRYATALVSLLLIAGARAQVSGSVTLASDYRYRGLSLSDERPAAELGVAYDGAAGWYAGAMVATVRPEGGLRLQLMGYAGVARPLRSGLDWDVGVQYTTVAGDARYRYPEAYLGLDAERGSVRLAYARRYFGQPSPALYLALDHRWPLPGQLRLLGHLGVLRHNGKLRYDSTHYRFDGRIGLGLDWHHAQLQLAWTVVRGSEGPYPFGYRERDEPARQAWVLSFSRAW